MQYSVTKKYARGTEMRVDSFKDMNLAKKYIQEKLAEDASLKINVTYCLYEGADVIEEFDQSKLDTSSQAQGSQQESSLKFTPTPFNMSPQPKGIPKSFLKEENEKKDKK